MKIKKILLEIENQDELLNIVDLKQKDYEEFLDLMQKLIIGYTQIISLKK